MVVAYPSGVGASETRILQILYNLANPAPILLNLVNPAPTGVLPGYRSARACPSRSFDGPEHGGGQAPALRWRGNFFYTVARGPVPRDRLMVRKPLLSRSARACPSRALDGPEHGGGQAPALR